LAMQGLWANSWIFVMTGQLSVGRFTVTPEDGQLNIKGNEMYNYKIAFTTESGRLVLRNFSGESEGEAIEHFESWAEGFDQVLQFEDIREIGANEYA